MQKAMAVFNEFEHKYLTPGNILIFSAVSGAVLTLFYMIFLNDIYRDVGNCYATFSRIFAEGGIRESLNPALPVMQILLAGSISALTSLEPLRALILANGIFYVGLIVPLYFFLKRFVSPKLAAWGVFAYIFAPKIIRFSLGGLPEPARNFFLVLSVFFVFSIFDKPKFYKTVLLGLALAGFTLSRSEGILVSLMMIGAMFLFQICMSWKKNRFKALQTAFFCAFFSFLFFLLFLAPRIYMNFQVTGYPTPDSRLDRYIHQYITPSRPLWSLEEKGKRYTEVSSQRPRKTYTFSKQTKLQFKQLSRGAYELYLVFLALGLLSAFSVPQIRRHLLSGWQPAASPIEFKNEYLYILLLVLMHAVVYFPLQTSYRYYTFAIPLFMPLTLGGLKFVWELGGKFKLQPLLAIAVAAVTAVQIVNGLHSLTDQKKEYRLAGEWIQRHLGKPGEKLKVLNYHGYVIYWINGTVANPYYGGPVTKPEYASDFDIAIVEPDNELIVNVLKSRKDVVEVDQPYSGYVTVFRKIK